jgi:hypothetical protein
MQRYTRSVRCGGKSENVEHSSFITSTVRSSYPSPWVVFGGLPEKTKEAAPFSYICTCVPFGTLIFRKICFSRRLKLKTKQFNLFFE